MDASLEYKDATYEARGAMVPGRLRFTDSALVFKNSKTGKVETINSSDIDVVNWQRLSGQWGIRIFTKNGVLYRFGGFKETDREKIAKFFQQRYELPMLTRELTTKGWNWGTAKFAGSVLSFDVGNDLDFEVPLNYVSQCTTGKNEVTLEFHPNDDAPVSLMELRFHIPSNELAGDDPVDSFKEQVTNKASIISAVGDAIAIFREIQCLTPRGRYDIKVFPGFFQLHGKTFDYKIPMSTVLRLFLLPHRDGRQTYFVVSLDPPIKQGQTRYHYLVCLFSQDEEDVSIELPFTSEELKHKYDGKLQREITGPMYEVVSKVMKAMVNRKITTPGNFKGHSGTPAVSCSYKAAAGSVYPLERGFIYIHKPPLHIRFEEILSVNFARGGGSTRSFDFEIETKSGVVHTFSSIEKEEYPKLFDYVTSKNLRVKNRGKLDKVNIAGDFDDSDAEEEPDAYLARVKAEARERSDEEFSEEGSSVDEDYDPTKAVVKGSGDDDDDISSDSEGTSEGSGAASEDEEKEEKAKKKKSKKTREPREGGRKKKSKGSRDKNAPKRPLTAFFMFLNDNREKIKAKYPDISVSDIAKKGGEMWKNAPDKAEYEEKSKAAMKEYKKMMEDYVPEPGSGGDSPKKSKKKSSSEKKPSSSKGKDSDKKRSSGGDTGGSGKGFKSKEFISDDSSSDAGGDSDDSGKKSKSKKKPDSKKDSKKESKKETKKPVVKKEKTKSESEGSASSEGESEASD